MPVVTVRGMGTRKRGRSERVEKEKPHGSYTAGYANGYVFSEKRRINSVVGCKKTHFSTPQAFVRVVWRTTIRHNVLSAQVNVQVVVAGQGTHE